MQILTAQVGLSPKNAGVRVSQCAAGTMAIWHEKHGRTAKWKDDKVMECILENAQCISINSKHRASHEQWNLQFDCCVTQFTDLASKSHFQKATWLTRLTSLGRTLRHHWTSSWRLAFAKGEIESNKPQLWRGNLLISVGISLARCLLWSCWLWIDTDDHQAETSALSVSLIMVHCNASARLAVTPFSFTITYMVSNITRERVCEYNTLPFSRHWSGDDELMPQFCQLWWLPWLGWHAPTRN